MDNFHPILNSDVWSQIMQHLIFFIDVICCRLLCNEALEGFYKFLQVSELHAYTKRTFIPMNQCMVCEQFTENTKMFVYSRDEYPLRRMMSCEKAKCFFSCFRKFICDANKEMCYPFVQWKNQQVLIPRSNGGFSIGCVVKRSPLFYDTSSSKLSAVVVFEKYVHKEQVPTIPCADTDAVYELTKIIPFYHIKTACLLSNHFLRVFNVFKHLKNEKT